MCRPTPGAREEPPFQCDGMFTEFLPDESVKLAVVEPGGKRLDTPDHAAKNQDACYPRRQASFPCRDSSLLTTEGSIFGDLMRSCLLTLNRPKTTSISFGATPNSRARNRTM